MPEHDPAIPAPQGPTPGVPAAAVGVSPRAGSPRSSGPDEPSDVELVQRVVNRDDAALAVLYDRYASAVFGLTRTVLRDPRLAEEASHDVFLHFWQNPSAFEPTRGSFAAWLLRVARNRAIDLLRRHREQPFAVASPSDGGQAIDPATWLVDPDPDPADQATSQLVRQDVRRALASLSSDHRRLLELAYFGGLTQREIAAHVDRPLGTVKTQIRTAMQRLAALMTAADPSLGRETRSTAGSDAVIDGHSVAPETVEGQSGDRGAPYNQ